MGVPWELGIIIVVLILHPRAPDIKQRAGVARGSPLRAPGRQLKVEAWKDIFAYMVIFTSHPGKTRGWRS
jgi:hypothetical protein